MLADLPVSPLTRALSERAASPAVGTPAFTYLDHSGSESDPEGAAQTLTWGELAARVRATATALASVTTPGDRVAILAPQDLGYVVGFLAALQAGTIAVPLFPPEVNRHGDRLTSALADCAPEAWLTTSGSLSAVRGLGGAPRPKHILTVDTIDDIPPGLAQVRALGPAPAADPDAPAYLQYTSGSTRTPAGVVITHHAVLANCRQVATAFGVDHTWTCTGWIPFFHDMGLVQLLCLPVVTGARSVFMTPFGFVMKPARWLRQLASYPNTFSAAPNFAFEYAARKVPESDRAGLDLSGVRALVNGSETVRPGTVSAFQEAFGEHHLDPAAQRPSYGLAEATVFVTCTGPEGPTRTAFDRAALREGKGVAVTAGGANSLELVAAGRPHGQQVRIVADGSGTPCDADEVGEIWVHGPNMASGYWGKPERSSRTFDGRLRPAQGELGGVADGTWAGEPPERAWLRTGDLGLVHDGLLYVTGRSKDLIIIDGKIHYPQDIEETVQTAHPAIRRDRVAAFPVTADGPGGQGAEGAAVVAEVDRAAVAPGRRVDEQEVARAVRRAVSAVHDVRLRGFRLVPPGGVVRTSSGKIARAANRDRYWPSPETTA